MSDSTATMTTTGAVDPAQGDVTLLETLPPVALVLGGVPVLTLLGMTAVRYVASGTL